MTKQTKITLTITFSKFVAPSFQVLRFGYSLVCNLTKTRMPAFKRGAWPLKPVSPFMFEIGLLGLNAEQ